MQNDVDANLLVNACQSRFIVCPPYLEGINPKPYWELSLFLAGKRQFPAEASFERRFFYQYLSTIKKQIQHSAPPAARAAQSVMGFIVNCGHLNLNYCDCDSV